MSALHRLAQKDSTIAAASLAIRLMFIVLDVAPILAKLLSKRGPYDAILARIETEVIKSEDEKIKNIEYEMENRSKFSQLKIDIVQNNDWKIFESNQKSLFDQFTQIQIKALETERWKQVVTESVNVYVTSLKEQIQQYARSFDLTKRELDHQIRPIFFRNAKKLADLISANEIKSRRVANSQKDFIKQSTERFNEMMRKYK